MEKDKKGRGSEEMVEREEEKESWKGKKQPEGKQRQNTDTTLAPEGRSHPPNFSREERKRQGSR